MHRRKRLGFLSLVLALVFLNLFSVVASAEIRLAVLPRLNIVEMHTMFKPLEDYLTAEIGQKVTIVTPKDFTAFEEMVKSSQVELGFSNPLIYVKLRKGQDLEPLALASEAKGGPKFRGIIIARRDSNISQVQDLKGKKLIFVDKDSAAGYIFQMLTLTKAGLDIRKDFTTLPFAKKHDNVAIAVFNGAADAGGIREDDLEKMREKIKIEDLKIVAYTDYYPNWPLFSTPKAGKEIAAKVRSALLKMKPGSKDAEKILGKAKLDGFLSVKDKDYDELRKAAKVVGAY